VLEQSYPHIRGRFLVLHDAASGTIVAGLPVYTVRSWLLGNRLVSVPFASVCDPLISSAQDFNAMLPALLAAQKQASARRLEIRARHAAPFVEDSSLSVGSIFKHHILDIDRDPEELFGAFKKSSVRQMIRKAQKAGVSIVEASQRSELRVCHEILSKTRRRLSLPPMPYAFFDAMRACLLPEHLRIFLAVENGRPVACVLVLISGSVWIAEHAGDTDEASPGVNQLLYWEVIRRAQRTGAKAFSFGRTSTSNHSLLTYKRRWATVEEDLASFEFPPGPGPMSPAGDGRSLQYRMVKSVLRNAPIGACQMIGRFCYRHLG